MERDGSGSMGPGTWSIYGELQCQEAWPYFAPHSKGPPSLTGNRDLDQDQAETTLVPSAAHKPCSPLCIQTAPTVGRGGLHLYRVIYF